MIDAGKDNNPNPPITQQQTNKYKECLIEADEWQKLIDLLPRSNKFDKVMGEAKEFEEKVLKFWIDFDQKKIEDKLSSLKSTSTKQEQQVEPMFADEISRIYASQEEININEKILEEEDIIPPSIPGEKKRGFFERRKLLNDKHSRNNEKKRVSEYWDEQKKSLKSSVEARIKELEQPIEVLSLDERFEKLSSNEGAEFNPEAPNIILERAETLIEAQKNLKKLEQYHKEMKDAGIDLRIPGNLSKLKEKIQKNIDKLENMPREEIEKIIRKSNSLEVKFQESLNDEINPSLYGILSVEFYRIPKKDQEDAINDFFEKEKNFIKQYQSFIENPVDKERDIDLFLEKIKLKKEKLRKKCEEIRNSYVCHMTLSNEEYAKSILRDGFLISAAGQKKLRGEAVVNSPVGQKKLLPEITFSINAVESKYGRTETIFNKIYGVTAPLKTEQDRGDRYSGVGFIFPYSTAVEGKIFHEEGSTQRSDIKELHVFNKNHDDLRHHDVDSRIDVNKGFFIVPRNKQRSWEIFLLTPKEDGGAGKNQEWVEEHVIFYPEYTDPSIFLKNKLISKSEPGILIPTDNRSATSGGKYITRLYEWRTLDGEILEKKEDLTPEESIKEIQSLLKNELPSKSLFDKYKPKLDWYLKKEMMTSALHGVTHEARVMIWQEILSRLLIKQGINLDQEALRWAAATHDTQRTQAIGPDLPHGDSSAQWVENNMASLMPPETLDKVILINKGHVPKDSNETMTPELAVFKDADGLDRVRIGDLNPNMLRHQISKDLLIKAAQKLFEVTRNASSFDEVITEAIKLGLVSQTPTTPTKI